MIGKYVLYHKSGGFGAIQGKVVGETAREWVVRWYSFMDGTVNHDITINKKRFAKLKWAKVFDDVSEWRRAATDHLNTKRKPRSHYPYRHAEDGGAY